jgi:hypothetical protein
MFSITRKRKDFSRRIIKEESHGKKCHGRTMMYSETVQTGEILKMSTHHVEMYTCSNTALGRKRKHRCSNSVKKQRGGFKYIKKNLFFLFLPKAVFEHVHISTHHVTLRDRVEEI